MSGQLIVRPFLESDELDVVRTWQAVFAGHNSVADYAAEIRRKASVQGDLLLVGETQGQIVATVMAGYDGHRGWIHRLAVLPQHRRCGFASAMMRDAESRLRAMGCTKVNLQVRADNSEVVPFYKQIGYSVEDRVSLGKPLEDAGTPGVEAESLLRIPVNERIHVTVVRPTDKAAFVEHLNDREIYERTLHIPHPYTEADAGRFLGLVAAETTRHGHPVNLAIRRPDERLIGGCGFGDLIPGHRVEIGYWLARPYWGQGIMTAVVGALCDYATVQWQIERFTAHVFDWNLASARVLEKNGFQLEGLLRKHHKKCGVFIDSRLYALVRA